MIMALQGFCGVSAHSTIARPRICPLYARKTGAIPFPSVGHVSAAYSFPIFCSRYKANEKSASPVRSCSSKGQEYSYMYAAAPFFTREYGSLRNGLLTIVKHSRKSMSPRAEKDDKAIFKGYPPMQTKPKWGWRVLACIPYMMSIHVVWAYAQTAYRIHPILPEYPPLAIVFLKKVLKELPNWFFTAYFFIGYLKIVRNNKFPHFFRYHVITGMLLEIIFSLCGQLNDFFPKSFYWGQIGALFWFFVFFAFLSTALMCVACALTGKYADVPFVSDAAYMQIPY